MQTLALSDEVVPIVYSLSIKRRFEHVRLVVGCGDLPYYYLEFVVTMLGVPCLYIHGNHDGPERTSGGELIKEARGCLCLEGRTVMQQGVLFAGLGGSIRYNKRKGAQYTEQQMLLRAWRLVPRLLLNRLRYGRYLDVLLTHAPPLGIHNGPDLPHRGFGTFLRLMQRFEPRYLIHGHIHRSYNFSPVTETRYYNTLVVNTAGYQVLNLQPPP
jgi:Icc-related predicted phosphoesterase